MISLKKRRRQHTVLAAFALSFAGAGLILYALQDGISYYKAPSDLLANPPVAAQSLRLGGLVAEGSLAYDHGTVRFAITDGAGTVPVVFEGPTPDLFGEGRGAVARGRYRAGVFYADQILAKHDETYAPRTLAEAASDPASAD